MGDNLNIAGYANDLARFAGATAPSPAAASMRRGAEAVAKADSPASQAAAVQAAKDFEGVLLQQVMQTMRETDESEGGLDGEDESSGQVKDLFWSFLSQDASNKGGMGLWKDIYRQTVGSEPPLDRPSQVELLK